jgi:NAD(P)-dependent dehydrogenase (short-subunit alcohol dehydrogenase family)
MSKASFSNGELTGKVAIVTGGASGIGQATCLALAKNGASVVVVDLAGPRLEETIGKFATEPSWTTSPPLGLTADVRNENDLQEMVQRTLDQFGRIDLLVHCAGILRGKGSGPKFLHQISLEEYEEVVDTNLKGTFLCNRAVLPAMMQQRQGHIINVSSTSGIKGRAFDSVYCASKFGIVGLSEALLEEVRQYGIRVHVVLPDAVDTPIWDQNGPVRAPKDSLPPERVADLIAYLAMLPSDMVLNNLVLLPFRTRQRKKQ